MGTRLMADTIRTLSELNTILADNGAGKVSAQDIRDTLISLMVHGEIGATDNDEITLGAGWETVNLDTAGVIKRGVTLNTTDHRIEAIPVDLKAEVLVHVTFLGEDGQNYEFAVYRDGGPTQVLGAYRKLQGAGTRPVSAQWVVAAQLSEDETLELAVKSAGHSFTLKNGLLRVQRIGAE